MRREKERKKPLPEEKTRKDRVKYTSTQHAAVTGPASRDIW
jgi:hypothetical protein